MIDQAEWVEVLKHPLGIAAFALFLVFLVLRRTEVGSYPWLTPVFITLSFILLIGGLSLGYLGQDDNDSANSKDNTSPPTVSIKIETSGSDSHGIGIVQGDQVINSTTNVDPANN